MARTVYFVLAAGDLPAGEWPSSLAHAAVSSRALATRVATALHRPKAPRRQSLSGFATALKAVPTRPTTCGGGKPPPGKREPAPPRGRRDSNLGTAATRAGEQGSGKRPPSQGAGTSHQGITPLVGHNDGRRSCAPKEQTAYRACGTSGRDDRVSGYWTGGRPGAWGPTQRYEHPRL